MKRTKILTKTCALTVTKDLRHELGLRPGQAVDIDVSDGQLIIKKHAPTCFFCGEISAVKNFKGYDICEKCRKEINND